MRRLVAVIGNGSPDAARDALAEEVGGAVVRAGFGLVTGGLGGVMAAASRGARAASERALVVALLPGSERDAAVADADVVIPTGMGYARNVLVILAADAVVAVGGESGTLSELAHAWQLGRPVCAVTAGGGWGARLAGEQLDAKRADAVFEAHSVHALEAWLESILSGAA